MESPPFTNSIINESPSVLSHLPQKDLDNLIERKLSQLGNFEPFNLTKPCQIEDADYDLEAKWKLNELNRESTPSKLFKANETELKSWESTSTMNLFDGKVIELGELAKLNRFSELHNSDTIDGGDSEGDSEDIHLNSSILNQSSLITDESDYRINYLSWDEKLNIRQNLRVSDNKFKKLKMIYDELNLDYIQSNEINIINISEEQLVKELIALLQLNPMILFEFNAEQNYFELNMQLNIQFDQSTQEALDSFCTTFLQFATNWIRLDMVAKTLLELPEIYGQLGLCFSQCLSNYLQLLQFNIIKLSEKKGLRPAQLAQEVSEMTQILILLAEFCSCQVELNLDENIDDEIKLEIIQLGFYLPKKVNLLSYLYETITLNYNASPQLIDFIYLSIFKECSEIWFNWINEAISFKLGSFQIGEYIQDPYNEFFIQFNKTSQNDSEGNLIDQNSTFMQEFGIIKEENIPSIHFPHKRIPQFFTLNLGESVLNAAKCLQMLKMLNSKGEEEYRLHDLLRYDSIRWDIWFTSMMEPDSDNSADYFNRIKNNLELIRESSIYEIITQFPSTFESSFFTTLDELISRADNISRTTLFFDPIPTTIYRSIHSPIERITQQIETLTMKQIIKDQKFNDHLQLVEALFLFQGGGHISLFIKETLEYFRKNDMFSIFSNLTLQKLINIKFKNFFSNLPYFDNLSNLLSLNVGIISSTNRALKFTINYDLPFPVNQLIPQSTQSVYHQLFTFLGDLIQFEFSLSRLYGYSKELIKSNPEIKAFLITLSNLSQFAKYWMFTSNQIIIKDHWTNFKVSLLQEVTVTKFIEIHSKMAYNLLEVILLENFFPRLKPSLYNIIYEVINFESKLNGSNLNIDDFIEFDKLLVFYFDELDKSIKLKCADLEVNLDELIILKGLV